MWIFNTMQQVSLQVIQPFNSLWQSIMLCCRHPPLFLFWSLLDYAYFDHSMVQCSPSDTHIHCWCSPHGYRQIHSGLLKEKQVVKLLHTQQTANNQVPKSPTHNCNKSAFRKVNVTWNGLSIYIYSPPSLHFKSTGRYCKYLIVQILWLILPLEVWYSTSYIMFCR